MEYEYDSYNRIQRMTYPDGEVVSYGYDYPGGGSGYAFERRYKTES